MPARFYRITISGVLTERLAAAFEPLGLAGVEQGRTALSGVCIDSAALYGVIDRIRDLGLDLLTVESSDPGAEPVLRPVPGVPRS